jgi:hypothetical protein
MRHLSPLCGTLLLSFITTACGPSVPTPTATDSQQIALLQEQIKALTKSSASPSPSSGSSSVAAVSGDAAIPVKTMQAQPAVLTVAPGQEKPIEMVVLVLENNSVSVLKKFDLLEITAGDSSVASVSKEGVIKGLKEGVTPVSLKLGNITQTLVVTVSGTAATATPTPAPAATATPAPTATATPVPTPTPTATPDLSAYKSLGVDKENYPLKTFETAQVFLTVTLQSDDVALVNDRTKAEWSSSNTSIASVSGSGLISANSVGTATMTVKFGGLTKTFTVTVTAS